MLLEGKVAVVSGLGPGMGRDISLALAAEGADIVMCARSEDRMATVAEEIEELGRRALTVQCDITSVDDCDAAWPTLRRPSSAASTSSSTTRSTKATSRCSRTPTSSEWRTTFEVNLFGSLQLTQALLPVARRRAATAASS